MENCNAIALEDRDLDSVFKPLTPDEAEQLRSRQQPFSMWKVLFVQAVASVVAVVIACAVGFDIAMSVAYGAASVLIPALIFVRGVLSRRGNLGGALLRMAVWELAKVGLTIAMLVAARVVLSDVHWLALVVGMVVAMKSSWFAVWMQAKSKALL